MSKKKLKSTLVILTRNEITGMTALIKKIPFDQVDEVFVVDYQSTDGTKEFITQHHIRLINQTIPGRGEAFRLAAAKSSGDYLAFFSPDGNEDPRDIPRLLNLLRQGNDLAIASRFLPESRNEEDDQLLKFRAWANQGFTWLVNRFWRGTLSDSINGYRAITKSAFKKLNLDAFGYAIEFQMSIRALKLGLRIAEIPTIEGDRLGGESGSKAIQTGLLFIKCLLKEIWIGFKYGKNGRFWKQRQLHH
ncbi:MAG: glycosyltransferase family 2 protein [Patescibacteria group bacterium]